MSLSLLSRSPSAGKISQAFWHFPKARSGLSQSSTPNQICDCFVALTAPQIKSNTANIPSDLHASIHHETAILVPPLLDVSSSQHTTPTTSTSQQPLSLNLSLLPQVASPHYCPGVSLFQPTLTSLPNQDSTRDQSDTKKVTERWLVVVRSGRRYLSESIART